MSVFDKKLTEIQEFIKYDIILGRSSIRPEELSHKLNISLETAMQYLLKMAEEGKLALKYEVRCTYLNRLHFVELVDADEGIIGKQMFCPKCNKSFTVELGNLFPLFEFREEYKEFVRDNWAKDFVFLGGKSENDKEDELL